MSLLLQAVNRLLLEYNVMASLYIRKNSKYIWVKWYNRQTKKYEYDSTRIPDTKDGWREAEKLKKEIEAGLILGFSLEGDLLDGPAKTIKHCYTHFEQLLSGHSKSTQDEYGRFYKKLTAEFPELSAVTILSKTNIESFLAKIRKIPKQRNTKYALFKNTRRFLNFLFDYEYIPVFKINKEYAIRPEIKNIVTFSIPDLTTIFDKLPEKSTNFQAAIYLLLYTGLRPSDILNLSVADINLKDHNIKYHSPKTDEYRMISFSQELKPLLINRMLEVQSGRLIEYSNVKALGKAFRRFCADNGLSKDYNLRTFRKTFISLAYNAGMELATVSKLVGHHNIGTTQKYYNKLSLTKQDQELSKLSLAKIVTEDRDSKKKGKKKAS